MRTRTCGYHTCAFATCTSPLVAFELCNICYYLVLIISVIILSMVLVDHPFPYNTITNFVCPSCKQDKCRFELSGCYIVITLKGKCLLEICFFSSIWQASNKAKAMSSSSTLLLLPLSACQVYTVSCNTRSFFVFGKK